MSLTREQALAAAGILALAFDAAAAAVPPGGTIAQGAAAGAAAAKAGGPTGGGHGAPKKVATAPGAVKYHAPIGALIVPHGHPHFVKGEPSHMVKGNISEAKWIANQWGDKGQAKAEAEKAVHEGTHHWVQAGQHSFAVHNSLETHVPKDTDIHDEAAVKNAPKIIVKHGEHPEHVMLHPDATPGEPQPHGPYSQHLLETGYKKLPGQPPKKSVTFEGKHAAWVPHDWQVHKSAEMPEHGISGKYAKDPEGNWHHIGTGGAITPVPAYNTESMENWIKSGQLVPDEDHPGPEPEHVAPNQGTEGHEPVKANIGGVVATKEEIQSAIQHLQQDKSTQVKGPLKAKGHPLQFMDYHAINAKELADHPELKVPKGTKKAHVGQVKVSVLHHLAGALDWIAKTEAEQDAMAKAAEAAKAAAEHAQQLAAQELDIGGVTASKEAIQDAIDALNATKSTSIKQILKAKGNPLASSDYWKVIHDYQAAHPAEKQKGTKQVHAPNAKTAFIAALTEKAGLAGQADAGSGHDVAAQTDQALTHAIPDLKTGWSSSANGAVAAALVYASDLGKPFYAFLSPVPGEWTVYAAKPEGKAFYEVTPEHKVILHLSDGVMPAWPQAQVADVVKSWVKKAGEPEAKPAVPKPMSEAAPSEGYKAFKAAEAAAKEPDPQPVWDTAAWKQTPEFQAVYDLIWNHPPGLPPHDNPLDTNQQLAAAMYLAAKFYGTRYLYPAASGNWAIGSKLPSGIAGTFGVPGKAYYEVSKDHEIIAYGSDGQPVALAGETIKQLAEKWLTPPPEPEKPAEPAAGTVPVTINGKVVYHAEPGTTLWYDATEAAPDTMVYLLSWDGKWQVMHEGDSKPVSSANSAESLNAGIVSGEIAPIGDAAEELYAKFQAAKPEPGGGIPVMVGGEQKGTVPAGSKFYKWAAAGLTEAAKAAVYVKKPDGAWTWYGLKGTVEYPAGDSANKDAQVAAGQLKEVSPEDLAATPAPESAKPEQGGFDVTAGGNTLHVPAGSKVYVSTKHPDITPGSEWADVKYVKTPDGIWKYVQAKAAGDMAPGVEHTLNAEVKSGHMVPWPPEKPAKPEPAKPEPAKPEPTPAEHDIQQLKTLLVNGAVKPSAGTEGGKANPDWVLVTALQKVAKTGSEKWAVKSQYSSGWSTYSYEPSIPADTEFFHVTADLAVMHHVADGADTAVPPEKVSELVQQLVAPDSVKIDVGGKYAIDYKIFKHGFYYKPSKHAKAYLEIGPPSPGHSGGTYTYHAPSGDKVVPAAYAAKVLTDATEYHAQPKDAPVAAAKKVSYATVAKPGTYQIWSDGANSPSPDSTVGLHDDGSVLLNGPGSSVPMSAQSETGMLEGGALLDQFGTTVVKPGVTPAAYHVFGTEAKTAEDLQSALNLLEQAYGDKLDITHILKDFLPGVAENTPVHNLAVAFWNAKLSSVSWEGQRDSFMGLLRELLQVPAQPPGTETAGPGGEVKFLKGLPPGIHDAKDVFEWTDKGYAKPFAGSYAAYGLQQLSYQTSPELATKIKQVGAQFGGGKVVGTHVSSLSKDQKVAWLKAWQAGDMAAVFNLDAFGGKVSPVHPGAPDNAATHHVTWAPWDETQIPAGQAIEGDWSPEGVMAPKAEVDNFLIKAGLQHAAWLTTPQRRQWMQAHRGNDQLKVDELSRQAADAFNSGAEPKSEPPKWTDDLGPAGPFDAFLDEKTPAQDWPVAALDAFLAVHKAEMEPFVTQAATGYGYGSYSVDELLQGAYGASYVKKPAVQGYLDDLAAKEAAEKLKPKYHLAGPGIAEDQFGRQYQFITGTPAELARRSAVAALARTWGFRTPQVTQMALEDGTAGAAAPLLQHEGTLAFLPAGIAGLTGRELGDIAREHVLDYALANPGSTPGSYLRTVDGSVIGADKSSALTDLGWQGTDPAAMNAQATQPVSLIFSAIADGSLSQEQAGAAYTAAIRAARRMAALSDSRLQQFADQAGLVTAGHDLIERKNALPDAIKAMWDGVFAHQGWTPPEIPVARLSRGLRSGFSEPEFMDHVAAAKSFGVPAFFAEPGLANGHVLVWTELSPGGERMVRGEAAVRGHVLDKVTGWVKAHSGESATMVPKEEASLHQAVKTAAEVINTHAADQIWSGPITSAALSELASAKAKLTHMLADAQHALAAGPASPSYAAVAQDYGDPASVVSMAQFYLAQIDTAEHAKVSGQGGLTPDQFPGWKPTEETHVLGGGVKITYKKSKRGLGTNASEVTADTWSLGKDDGELHLAAGKHADYPGYVWQVELPTGEVIEINDSGETQTPKAHTGMVRFTSVTSDGSASLERIRAFLQQAGLPMEEAGQADMENLYWRTMAWVLSDRADRKDPKHLKVWDELAQGLYGKNAGQATGPGKEIAYLGELPAKVIQQHMAPEEETQLWRKAWAHLTSPEQVQQWVDSEGFLPHLGHYDIRAPEVPGGKPDWFRFDVTPQQVASGQLVTQGFYDSGDAALVARSGGLYSSDARLRALGTYKTGMSWGSDMEYGSSGTVFTRQNQQSETAKGAWISPRVLARVQTYTFDSDHFGKTEARRTNAYFDYAKATAHSMSSNEAMVMDAISLLDDIEVLKAGSEAQRKQIIADLKGAGLTMIRGLPVEDRIVTSSGVHAAVQKAIAAAKSDGWFTQPELPYIPPASALSGAPAAEKKFAQKTGMQEKMADAAAQAAKVAQQLEELAKGAEAPFSYAQ